VGLVVLEEEAEEEGMWALSLPRRALAASAGEPELLG
jgi:hypothetical protein